MATIIRTERRKRGLIGHSFLLLFWSFNGFMAFALVSGLAEMGEGASQIRGEAERAGYEAGIAIGTGLVMVVWAAGALVLGLLAHFTRGPKVVIENTEA